MENSFTTEGGHKMNIAEKKIRRFGLAFKTSTERKLDGQLGFVIGMSTGVLGMVAMLVSFMYLLPLTMMTLIALFMGLAPKREVIIFDLITAAIGPTYFSEGLITATILTIGILFAIFGFGFGLTVEYGKLPEIAIPDAERAMKNYPEFKKMLAVRIGEARKINDGDEIRSILDKITEIVRLRDCAKADNKKIVNLKTQLGVNEREENDEKIR